MLDEVAGVIRPLPDGIVRDDLVKLASGRLGISRSSSRARSARARPAAATRGGRPEPPRAANGARQALDRREQSERAFLALCVALPELGEAKLAEADLDARVHLTADPPRRRAAARPPRGALAAILGEEPELAPLVAELASPPGRLDATPATLELEALQLDLHRLDREISAARTAEAGEGMQTLAAERQKVLDASSSSRSTAAARSRSSTRAPAISRSSATSTRPSSTGRTRPTS